MYLALKYSNVADPSDKLVHLKSNKISWLNKPIPLTVNEYTMSKQDPGDHELFTPAKLAG